MRPRFGSPGGTPQHPSPGGGSSTASPQAGQPSPAPADDIPIGVPVKEAETTWDAPSWARARPRSGSLISERVKLFEQSLDVDKHQRNISKHAEDPEFLLALKAAAHAAQLLHSANPTAIHHLPDRIVAENLPDLELPPPRPSGASPASRSPRALGSPTSNESSTKVSLSFASGSRA